MDKVSALERVCFPDRPYTRLDFVNCIFQARDGFIVACKDDLLVGYVVGMSQAGDGWAVSLVVAPEFRRKGMGEMLAKSVIEQLSKSPDAYVHRTPQTSASRLLVGNGVDLQPGRIVRFLITDSDSKEGIPEELLAEGQRYDVSRYLEFLVSAGAILLEPFGYGKGELASACEHPLYSSSSRLFRANNCSYSGRPVEGR